MDSRELAEFNDKINKLLKQKKLKSMDGIIQFEFFKMPFPKPRYSRYDQETKVREIENYDKINNTMKTIADRILFMYGGIRYESNKHTISKYGETERVVTFYLPCRFMPLLQSGLTDIKIHITDRFEYRIEMYNTKFECIDVDDIDRKYQTMTSFIDSIIHKFALQDQYIIFNYLDDIYKFMINFIDRETYNIYFEIYRKGAMFKETNGYLLVDECSDMYPPFFKKIPRIDKPVEKTVIGSKTKSAK